MEEMIAVGIAIGIGGAFGGKLLEALEAKKAIRAERKRREQKRKAFVQAHEDFVKNNI